MLDNNFTNPLWGYFFVMGNYHGLEHVSELEKLLQPPSKERVGKMDEVENNIFHLIRNLTYTHFFKKYE